MGMKSKPLVVGTDLMFLVIGDRCWGKGKTENEAKAKARQSGGSGSLKSHDVYLVPPSAYLDPMGDIYWTENAGCVVVKKVRDGKTISN